MKGFDIIFDASRCGLGSNGGMAAIIKSSNALIDLGYSVGIKAKQNGYKWGEVKAPTVSR